MEQKRYLKSGETKAYQTAFHLSTYVWDIILTWEWFPKKTVGGQFAEAIDGISAIIAEGFGRYHKNGKIKFYRYVQG
ncbi:MAG: four helix bundle protein [Bacteroidota bacterium]